jgi:putative ABC transport system permease protein
LKGKNFNVVGVLERKGSSGFENPDQAVLIPLFVAQKELLGIRHVSFLRALVDDELYVDQSAEEIKQTLLERHNDEDFSVRTVADLLSILTTVTNGLKFFLVFVASIALFVGGVGIMNIMLIAVKEKTREIGLRKAVGARDEDIMWQFLIETVVLALSGGFVGCVIGIFLSYLIVLVIRLLGNEFVFSLSFFAIALSLILTILIGLIFGLIPSRKASRLPPMEALRYE